MFKSLTAAMLTLVMGGREEPGSCATIIGSGL